MKYLPIFDELFSSDSIIFMLIGLALAAFVGIKMKGTKKNLIGIIVSFIVYAICEIISNVHTTFWVEFLLLFIGTLAIGCIIGFGIGLIVGHIRLSLQRNTLR